jgi:hypothetical protein
MQIWDLANGAVIRRWTNGDNFLFPESFLANGEKLLTYSRGDRMLREFDIATGSEIQSWHAPPIYEGTAVSPNEQRAVSVGIVGDAVLRDLSAMTSTNMTFDLRVPAAVSRWMDRSTRFPRCISRPAFGTPRPGNPWPR